MPNCNQQTDDDTEMQFVNVHSYHSTSLIVRFFTAR